MIHHTTKQGGHFSVAMSSQGQHVLVQIQNKYGDQAREALDVHEAEHLVLLVLDSIQKLKLRNK